MARKSSKTAHVLNLLSGHDNKKEPEKAQPAETPAVSIIDKSEEDPVAERIQEELLNEFQKEYGALSNENDNAVTEQQLDELVVTSPEHEKEFEPELDVNTTPDPALNTEPEIQPEPEFPEAEPTSEATPELLKSEPEAAPAAEVKAEEEIQEEIEVEEEPDFVRVNLMEEIVNDKIIYFMRQFECCTCDRCIADTVALTLNGLPPKYIVTEPAAKEPLISFYTNRFISDITVEATKACMFVKENPRHK